MDFDTPIDRRGTGALKWDILESRPGKEDIIPLWVADMDFPAPPAVTTALLERSGHPIYGYTKVGPGLIPALVSWYGRRYGAELESDDIILGPGSVASMGITVRACSEPGDGVLVLTPVYYPFYEIIRDNGRRVVAFPLELGRNGRYRFDPAALETALVLAKQQGLRVPLMLFCSPHNPGGAVWEKEELSSLLAIAERQDLIILSDEVHGDFVHHPRRFLSLAALEGGEDRKIVLSSANKTFNLAGLHLSHFVSRDRGLRERLRHGLRAMGHSQSNVFSLAAVEAAYTSGESWLEELLEYLGNNLDFALDFIDREIPGVRAYRPEGTYLMWADARELIRSRNGRSEGGNGVRGSSGDPVDGSSRNADAQAACDDRGLAVQLEEEARVKVTAGSVFGQGGEGFLRINVACPRSQLAEGLRRLAAWAKAQP